MEKGNQIIYLFRPINSSRGVLVSCSPAGKRKAAGVQPRGASPQTPPGQAGVGSLINDSQTGPVSSLHAEHLQFIFLMVEILEALSRLS